jgi:SAM-dependent methyltransferase
MGCRRRPATAIEGLLPDRLAGAWAAVEAGDLTEEQYGREHDRLLGEHAAAWAEALRLEGEVDLERSLLGELAGHLGISPDEVRRRCQRAGDEIEVEWRLRVDAASAESIECFYDQSPSHLYELTWWHTLVEDRSPLAYVVALRFGLGRGCRSYLDYGAGIGSGGLLFARHGCAVDLADISSLLLRFAGSRFARRGLPVGLIDLRSAPLPAARYDLITVMDVIEHLVDPVAAVEQLHRALRPGGHLFGRFAVERDDERGEHIVRDLEPVFARMRELGLVEVWRDEWLWGHQAFRRS